MKKTFVFFILVLVVLGSCATQYSNAAPKIVGTWTDSAGKMWVFGDNGQLTLNGSVVKYGVINTKLAISFGDDLKVFDVSISADGKTLFLTNGNGNSGQRIPYSQYWLTKQ